MNLTDRMEFQKMKQKFANGKNLTDTDICMLFACIQDLTNQLQHFENEYQLVFGKSKTGGKTAQVKYNRLKGDPDH